MFSGGLRGEILGDSMDEERRRGAEGERGRFKEGFWEEREGFSGRRVVWFGA